jgi:MYXO-CTERM domain-containing protein
MNLRVKLVFSIGLLGFLCLLLPASLPAETIYTYTGNTFTACTNVFVDESTGTCVGGVSLTFETSLIGSQLYNLSNFDITGTDILLSVIASDGPGDVAGDIRCFYGCQGPIFASVQISTNAVGDIIGWNILASNVNDGANVTNQVTATNLGDTGRVVVDFGLVFCGDVPCQSVASTSVPGIWSAPVATLEPGPGGLTLIGLGGLLLLRKRRATQMEAS